MTKEEKIVTDLKKLTEPELRDIMKAGEDASKELVRRMMKVSLKISKRLEVGDTFKREELILAKHARCHCGEKLAYPRDIGKGGAWHCSTALMGTATHMKHDEPKPFVFWEIKGEDQP